MEFWNFKDLHFLTFFVVVMLLLTMLVIYIIFHHSNAKQNQINLSNRSLNNSLVRVLCINLNQCSITFFNKNNLRDKKTMPLELFNLTLQKRYITNFKKWISDISSEVENTPNSFEAEINVENNKKAAFALFELIKFDKEKGLIFLESNVLNNVIMAPKKRRASNKDKVFSSTDVKRLLNQKNLDKGVVFGIKFYYVRHQSLSKDKIERLMSLKLKNEVYPFATSKKLGRCIYDVSSSEIFLFDTKMNSREEALKLAKNISKNLSRTIQISGIKDSINYSIGIISYYQYSSFCDVMDKMSETWLAAQVADQRIYIHQKRLTKMPQNSVINEQISRLLSPKQIRYLYRPVVDVSTKKIIAYFTYFKGYNTTFSNYAEMSKYAFRVGKSHQLIAEIANHSITKFINERASDKYRLFFNASLNDIDHILDIFPQIRNYQSAKVVIVFNEDEFNENPERFEMIEDLIHKMKNEKYELGLMFNNEGLLLEPDFYKNFNYFIINGQMISEIKKNHLVRLNIYSLVESLLKYKKPIIATDVENWQAIELLIKSGINYLSSDTISSCNDMLLPIEKKILNKLALMDESFR